MFTVFFSSSYNFSARTSTVWANQGAEFSLVGSNALTLNLQEHGKTQKNTVCVHVYTFLLKLLVCIYLQHMCVTATLLLVIYPTYWRWQRSGNEGICMYMLVSFPSWLGGAWEWGCLWLTDTEDVLSCSTVGSVERGRSPTNLEHWKTKLHHVLHGLSYHLSFVECFLS